MYRDGQSSITAVFVCADDSMCAFTTHLYHTCSDHPTVVIEVVCISVFCYDVYVSAEKNIDDDTTRVGVLCVRIVCVFDNDSVCVLCVYLMTRQQMWAHVCIVCVFDNDSVCVYLITIQHMWACVCVECLFDDHSMCVLCVYLTKIACVCIS